MSNSISTETEDRPTGRVIIPRQYRREQMAERVRAPQGNQTRNNTTQIEPMYLAMLRQNDNHQRTNPRAREAEASTSGQAIMLHVPHLPLRRETPRNEPRSPDAPAPRRSGRQGSPQQAAQYLAIVEQFRRHFPGTPPAA